MWNFFLSVMRATRDLMVGVSEPAAPIEWYPVTGWKIFDGPLASRPKNRAELIKLLGDPTRNGLYLKKADPRWVRASIVELHGPDAFLPVLAKSYFPIHRLIEPYAREAFHRAEISHPGYVKREGTWGFNFRRIRHDTPEKARAEGRPLRPLSIHSYGAAIDVNPEDNRGHIFAPGLTPDPWSQRWWKTWPRGVSRVLVEAFESCGFFWGGRWKGYVDPMHFEWIGPSAVQV